MNFLSTQWSTDGSTSSEPMGLCITSIVKTLTDNHTLDDRNRQWHHTTLLLSEILLDHFGSRTTTSGLWQSTPRDMSRCLASSGQHLVDGEGSSGSSSGSSRMMRCWLPPPTPQTNHWHGYSSVSLTDWSAAVVAAFTGLEPPHFYMWGYLKDRVYGNNPQTIPDLKAEITAATRAIQREECGRVIENFARRIQMCLQRRGLISTTFLSASETKSFCSTDLKLRICLLHRLDLM